MNTGSITTTSGSLGVDISGPQTTDVADTVTTDDGNITVLSDWLNGTGLKYPKNNTGSTAVISTKVERLEHLAVIYMCILGVLVIFANVTVLAISKFATGGKSPTLIFVRSLCFADCLAGLYAVIKTIFIYVDVEQALVNCFLGECLFFTSLMASVFTLSLLTADCFFRLLYPLQYQNYMDKKLVIIYMMFLWNFSFIIGFCPLNGWNNDDYNNDQFWSLERCMFFHYYPSAYFMMVTSIFVICVALMFGLHVKISCMARRKEWWAKRFGRQRADLKKTMKVVNLIRMDMIASCVFYLPFFIYTLLYCKHCVWHDKDADALYLFFIPYMLIKSLLNAMIHGGQTSQFQQVLHQLVRSHSLAEAFSGSSFSARASQQEIIPSVDATLHNQNRWRKSDASSVTLDAMVSLVSGPNLHIKNRHQPIKMQVSNSTVLTDISVDSDPNLQNKHQPLNFQVSNSTVLSNISDDADFNFQLQHWHENQGVSNSIDYSVISTDTRQKESQPVTLSTQNRSCLSKNTSSSFGLPKHPPLRRTKSAEFSLKNGRADAVRHIAKKDSFHLPRTRHFRFCPVHGHHNPGFLPEQLPVQLESKQSESRFADDVPASGIVATSSGPVVVAVNDEITAL
jgi:hypothetical protein